MKKDDILTEYFFVNPYVNQLISDNISTESFSANPYANQLRSGDSSIILESYASGSDTQKDDKMLDILD